MSGAFGSNNNRSRLLNAEHELTTLPVLLVGRHQSALQNEESEIAAILIGYIPNSSSTGAIYLASYHAAPSVGLLFLTVPEWIVNPLHAITSSMNTILPKEAKKRCGLVLDAFSTCLFPLLVTWNVAIGSGPGPVRRLRNIREYSQSRQNKRYLCLPLEAPLEAWVLRTPLRLTGSTLQREQLCTTWWRKTVKFFLKWVTTAGHGRQKPTIYIHFYKFTQILVLLANIEFN